MYVILLCPESNFAGICISIEFTSLQFVSSYTGSLQFMCLVIKNLYCFASIHGDVILS